MNSILAKASESHTNNIRSSKPSESIETAGSLAMSQKSLFSTNVYDMFTSSNPFSVDYSQYAESDDTVAYNSGFLSSFSNAVSTLSSGDFSGTGTSSACGSYSAGASSGASCGSSSGSFSSVC